HQAGMVNLAQSHQAGIVVSSCSGLISEVILLDLVSRVLLHLSKECSI
ncbi:hypothetical protein A2U01_0097416, partial [Trifolium medium]|nr:hypothetical protein [Trifolium medium]